MPDVTASFEYQVPTGYVGVLRGFSMSPNKVLNVLNIGSRAPNFYFRVTIFKDGSAAPQFKDMWMPQVIDYYELPTHIICSEGGTLGIQCTYKSELGTDTGGSSDTVYIGFNLYGQLLLSRGLPANQEIGNVILGGGY